MADERIINVASPVMEDMITPYFTKLVNDSVKIELHVLDVTKFVNRFKLLYSGVDMLVFKLYIEHTIFNLDKVVYIDDMCTIDTVIDAVEYLVNNDLDNMSTYSTRPIPKLTEEDFYNLITVFIDYLYRKVTDKDNLIVINWDEMLTKTTLTVLGRDGISLDSIVT